MDSTKVKQLGSNSAYPSVVKAFGNEILQQSTSTPETAPQVDRQKLGDVIFRDKIKRRILNKLTHPRIIRIMLKRIVWYHLAIHPARVVVVDIPLLFEAGKWMEYLFGYIVVVGTTSDTQLDRLMKRNPELTKEQCQHRIKSQYPIQTKVDKADAVLWNESDRFALETSLDNIKRDIIHSYQHWGRTTFGGVVLWIWLQAVMLLSMEYWSRS
jgi:dephospho-CoA kinase